MLFIYPPNLEEKIAKPRWGNRCFFCIFYLFIYFIFFYFYYDCPNSAFFFVLFLCCYIRSISYNFFLLFFFFGRFKLMPIRKLLACVYTRTAAVFESKFELPTLEVTVVHPPCYSLTSQHHHICRGVN